MKWFNLEKFQIVGKQYVSQRLRYKQIFTQQAIRRSNFRLVQRRPSSLSSLGHQRAKCMLKSLSIISQSIGWCVTGDQQEGRSFSYRDIICDRPQGNI